MPIIELNTNNVWVTFALTSFLFSLTTLIALYAKSIYDEYTITDEHQKRIIKQQFTATGVIMTFLITFFAAYIGYTIIYLVFGVNKG